jgi:hypothetical protein
MSHLLETLLAQAGWLEHLFTTYFAATHVTGITTDTALRRAVARKQAASQARWLAAHRFGPAHLRQVVRKMAFHIPQGSRSCGPMGSR